jgi:hypothetical protein
MRMLPAPRQCHSTYAKSIRAICISLKRTLWRFLSGEEIPNGDGVALHPANNGNTVLAENGTYDSPKLSVVNLLKLKVLYVLPSWELSTPDMPYDLRAPLVPYITTNLVMLSCLISKAVVDMLMSTHAKHTNTMTLDKNGAGTTMTAVKGSAHGIGTPVLEQLFGRHRERKDGVAVRLLKLEGSRLDHDRAAYVCLLQWLEQEPLALQ